MPMTMDLEHDPQRETAMNKLIFGSAILMALALSSPTKAQEPTNPVGFALSCNIPAAQFHVFRGRFRCRQENEIVIEQVSARVNAPSGQTVQLYVSTSSNNLPNGTIAARHYVVLTPTNSGTFYFANQQFRMYSMSGSNVSIRAAH